MGPGRAGAVVQGAVLAVGVIATVTVVVVVVVVMMRGVPGVFVGMVVIIIMMMVVMGMPVRMPALTVIVGLAVDPDLARSAAAYVTHHSTSSSLIRISLPRTTSSW